MSNEMVINLPSRPISADMEIDPIEIEFMTAEKPVVLITGVAGRIGSRLAEACAGNYRVVGLDVMSQVNACVDSIACDLNDDESVISALAMVRERYGGHLASVIHIGTCQDFSAAPPEDNPTPMLEYAGRLLNGLRDFVVEQFVFSSATLVMAHENAGACAHTEDAPTKDPVDPRDYPGVDFEIERFIQQEPAPSQGNIPTVIVRIAGVYDENCHSLTIAQQISRIYEKRIESYFYPGDVDRGQPFIRLDDLVECFLRIIELRLELEPCEIFLIAEPDVMSYAELQEQIGELLHGEEWTTIPIPRLMAKAGAWAQETIFRKEPAIRPETVELIDTRYQAEIERTKKRLGWQPQHSLRDTLSKIIGRLKENPHRWYETNNLPPPGDET